MPVTKYIWDPESDNVLQETDELRATTATYTQEPSEFGGLISQNRGGTKSYYHFDALGSTRELTDENENVTDTNMYDAWGVNVASSGTTENPFRWVGEVGYYFDEETDEYYVRARSYQPTTARFNAMDPLDGVILRDLRPFTYLYAQNSPFTRVDPSGLLSQSSQITIEIPPELGGGQLPPYRELEVGLCGRYWWKTRWVLGPSEQSGLIIQRVEFGLVDIRRCPEAAHCKIDPFFVGRCDNHRGRDAQDDCNGIYYEVWRVKDGSVFIHDVFRENPRTVYPFDVFAWPGCKNPCDNATFGHIQQRGDAFFIPDETWTKHRQRLNDTFEKGRGAGIKNACSLNSACAADRVRGIGTVVDFVTILNGGLNAASTKSVFRDWNCCDCGCEDGSIKFWPPGIEQ